MESKRQEWVRWAADLAVSEILRVETAGEAIRSMEVEIAKVDEYAASNGGEENTSSTVTRDTLNAAIAVLKHRGIAPVQEDLLACISARELAAEDKGMATKRKFYGCCPKCFGTALVFSWRKENTHLWSVQCLCASDSSKCEQVRSISGLLRTNKSDTHLSVAEWFYRTWWGYEPRSREIPNEGRLSIHPTGSTSEQQEKSLQPIHFQTDLDEMIKAVDMRRAKMIDVCKEQGAKWPSEQVSYWEGVFAARMDMLKDLRTMQDSWKKEQGAYRVTEKMLEEKSTTEVP